MNVCVQSVKVCVRACHAARQDLALPIVRAAAVGDLDGVLEVTSLML